MIVWGVSEFHNCQGDEVQELDGTPILAVYASKQTALQHVAREGGRYTVVRIRVRSSLGPNWGLS